MALASADPSRTSERATHLIRIFRPRRQLSTYLDLGCGTGTITKQIAVHYKIAKTYGIDLHALPEEECGPVVIGGGPEEDAPCDSPVTPNTPPTPPQPEPEKKAPKPPMALGFDDDDLGLAPPLAMPKKAEPPPPPPPRPKVYGGPIRYEYRQLKDDVIPLPDNSVDLITVFMAIHHFENFDKMISELVRVLQPSGFLFIREHDVAAGDKVLKATLDNMHKSFSDHMTTGVLNYWPRAELKARLIEGWKLKHVLDDDYPPSVPNPQSIYHSLYAKEDVSALKYIPPSERKAPPAKEPTPKVSPKIPKRGSNEGDKWSSWRN